MTASAPGSNVSLNTRVAFWRRDARVTGNRAVVRDLGRPNAAVNQKVRSFEFELANGVRRHPRHEERLARGELDLQRARVEHGLAGGLRADRPFRSGPGVRAERPTRPLPWRLCAQVVGDVVLHRGRRTNPGPRGRTPPGGRRCRKAARAGRRRLVHQAPAASDSAALTNLASGPVAPDERVEGPAPPASTPHALAPAVTHGKL